MDTGIDAHEYPANLNVTVFSLFNAMEKNERQWRMFAGEAALVVRNMRVYSEYGDAIIVVGKE